MKKRRFCDYLIHSINTALVTAVSMFISSGAWSITLDELPESQKTQVNEVWFAWSNQEALTNMHCVQVREGFDHETWSDNHFCASENIGMKWSVHEPIDDMACTQINEPSEPRSHKWYDNYLCLPKGSPFKFAWSHSGQKGDKHTLWDEASDEIAAAWEDNYLTISVNPLFTMVNGVKFAWSYKGPISGMTCESIIEPSDNSRHTWGDNYFCTSEYIGMKWSVHEPIDGMSCIQVNEPLESQSHKWYDNYLCLPQDAPFVFSWSHSGETGLNSVHWYEGADPEGWSNNYLTITLEESITPEQAVRFLDQATFGPDMDSINQVQLMGIEAWLDQQISPDFTVTEHHKDIWKTHYAHLGYKRTDSVRLTLWWHAVLNAEDQLRQKVAYALSQLLVVSGRANKLNEQQHGLTNYYDILVRNAFGNFSDLLKAVSKNPVMGSYLTHAGSVKSDGKRKPDENYARELLQLFSVGLDQLAIDGTPLLDEECQRIPVYDENLVQELARVFTGWCFESAHPTNPNPVTCDYRFGRYKVDEMVPVESNHDGGEKKLTFQDVNGQIIEQVIAAGGTAKEDMDQALDFILRHPNVAPFISKFLIQRLVTSNPKPEYVADVAQVFNNSDGNIGKVVRAILMHDEARDISRVDSNYGKMREPIMRLAYVYRALDGTNPYVYTLDDIDDAANQAPLDASSVFGFYPVNYRAPILSSDNVGGDEGMVSPEFALINGSRLIDFENYAYEKLRFEGGALLYKWNHIRNDYSFYEESLKNSWSGYSWNANSWNYSSWDKEPALDRFNLLFFAGRMSDPLREEIGLAMHRVWKNSLHAIKNGKVTYKNGHQAYMFFAYGVMTIFMSPEFVIQK